MTDLDPATKALLLRVRDLLTAACVSGMPGSGFDYEAGGSLLVDVLAALPDEPGSEA